MLITCSTVVDAHVVEYVHVYEIVCLLVQKLDTLLRGDVDFHSMNDVEVSIVVSPIHTGVLPVVQWRMLV